MPNFDYTDTDIYWIGQLSLDNWKIYLDNKNNPKWWQSEDAKRVMSIMNEEKQENVNVENLFTPAETSGSIKLKLADGEKELKVGDIVYMVNFGYFAEIPLCRPYWFIEGIQVSSFRVKFNIIDFARAYQKDGNVQGYIYSQISEPSYSIQKGHAYFNGIFSDYEKALEFAKKFSKKAKKALTI